MTTSYTSSPVPGGIHGLRHAVRGLRPFAARHRPPFAPLRSALTQLPLWFSISGVRRRRRPVVRGRAPSGVVGNVCRRDQWGMTTHDDVSNRSATAMECIRVQIVGRRVVVWVQSRAHASVCRQACLWIGNAIPGHDDGNAPVLFAELLGSRQDELRALVVARDLIHGPDACSPGTASSHTCDPSRQPPGAPGRRSPGDNIAAGHVCRARALSGSVRSRPCAKRDRRGPPPARRPVALHLLRTTVGFANLTGKHVTRRTT